MRGRIREALWNGEVIAESDDMVVVEGNHYFPRESLKNEYLEPSSRTSVCPWKGMANYYSLKVAASETMTPLGTTLIPRLRHKISKVESHLGREQKFENNRARFPIAAELPLLYPLRRRSDSPKLRFPLAVGSDPRASNRQPKLEAQPFLLSLPVFRYARSM